MADKHLEIAQAYVDGMTLQQCAEKFGVAVGTVRHALTKHAIKPRKRSYRSDEFEPPVREKKEPEQDRYLRAPFESIKESPRHNPVKSEIIKMAVAACQKFDGFASIDGRYAIVDTTKFEVRHRDE